MEKHDIQEVLYILKQLALVSAAVEQVCDDILYPKSLPMGRIMNYRYLCLDLYLWHGYLDRLYQTDKKDFACKLLQEFRQQICKKSGKIENLRNCATHYQANCDMDIMIGTKNDSKFYLSEYLPTYSEIKKYFSSWETQVISLIADIQHDLTSYNPCAQE